MNTETDHQFMHRQLDRIEHLAAREFPGALIHHAIFHDHQAPTRIFGLQGPNAVVHAHSTVYQREGQGWWINLNVALGFEIANIPAALHWTNQKNLQALNGRYYVGVAHHGQWCSVMWEHNIWCGLLEGLDGPDPVTVETYIAGCLLAAYREADSTPPQVQATLGGRPCPRGEQGLHWTFATMY